MHQRINRFYKALRVPFQVAFAIGGKQAARHLPEEPRQMDDLAMGGFASSADTGGGASRQRRPSQAIGKLPVCNFLVTCIYEHC
jgi:hypothetical protein